MKPDSNRPDIILFFTDQQRWDTVGLNGCPLGLTPHFDRLARRGTFFPQAVTPQPVCGPARSCIFTGQYATTTGVFKNGPGLKAESPKLAELLAGAGYRTGYIGKWHLSEGTGDGAVPADRRGGFQDWLGANCVELVSGPYSARLWDNDNREVSLPGYRSDALADAAVRYVADRHRDAVRQPYFLTISFLEPHHQNTDDSYPAPHGMERAYDGGWLPADLRALGGTSARDWAGYCAMIKRLDDALGRLMDALESLGSLERTVIAFVSDHGCHFKTRNSEYKRSPHESSVRVPFALAGGPWTGGGEHAVPASLVDLAPSLLETAGIRIPDTVQGRSLLAALRPGGRVASEFSYIQFGDSWLPPGRALRSCRWKYAVTATDAFKGAATAPSYTETHLYDLRSDPHELNNLISSAPHAPLRAELRERMHEWIARAGEPPATIVPVVSDGGFTQRTLNPPGQV